MLRRKTCTRGLLKRTQEECGPKRFEALAHLDIIIALNPSKTVALLPKGHVPTLQETALCEGVDV